jgi:hypothetical protein
LRPRFGAAIFFSGCILTAQSPQILRISSQHDIRSYRKAKGVALEEIEAAELGRGLSRGRISMAERGLCQLNSSEIARLIAAIDRIGELHLKVRAAKALVSQIDLADLCADLRF